VYPITTITISILAFIFVAISIKTIQFRRVYKVSMGDNGHQDLQMLIRSHGNFSEYVPITLILLLCAEANHGQWLLVSVLALLFVLGRVFHAYAFIFNKHHFKFRKSGMVLTFLCIILLSVLNVILLCIR